MGGGAVAVCVRSPRGCSVVPGINRRGQRRRSGLDIPPPPGIVLSGKANVRDAVVRYLQRRGGILLPPTVTLSLRVRGLALYLGMIRRGRLEWVVSLGATCRERWRGKIRLFLFLLQRANVAGPASSDAFAPFGMVRRRVANEER